MAAIAFETVRLQETHAVPFTAILYELSPQGPCPHNRDQRLPADASRASVGGAFSGQPAQLAAGIEGHAHFWIDIVRSQR